MTRIAVFGLGYVGTVSAACLARAGHDVTGVETQPEKVALINAGRSPVVEPGLEAALAEAVRAGRLRASSSCADAIARSDLALICVGTPSGAGGRLDVGALARVGGEIGRALAGRREPYTVVLRSTVLPGTTHQVLLPALRAAGRLRAPLDLAVNPEFLREGSALRDFAAPPMTLVGCETRECAERVASLYSGIAAPFAHTTVKTAEMVKYASNAFHALKVCFANEIGDVCLALGADAQEVMRIVRLDRKLNVSEAYLRPGYAFGGSCLPKDVRALLHAARHADVPLPLLGSILPSNEIQVRHAIASVLATGRRRVGVVGLAFKPGTDDLRESPMVSLVEALIGKGCDVRILDRNVSIARLVGANRRYIEQEIPHIASLMCESAQELVAHAQALVIGSAGDEVEAVLAEAFPDQVVVDLTRRGLGRGQAAAVQRVSFG
jgi:GDP-mannose 6-dehydrogenase